MSKDLDEMLGELGPGYRGVVARLRAAREIEPLSARRWPADGFSCRLPALLAASVAAAVLVSALVLRTEKPAPRAPYAGAKVYTVAYASTPEALEQIVASQRADGSWANDFLTQQNAAALRASQDARLHLAYRRAVRYLRSKGLSPLTDEELSSRASCAAQRLSGV